MAKYLEFENTTLVNSSMLQVNGKSLWADVLPRPSIKQSFEVVSPKELEQSLKMGRIAIYNALEEFYSKQYRELTPQGYTINRPSLWVAQLGTGRQTDGADSKVYSAKGYANGGIHYDKDEQHEEFWPFWDAVRNVEFFPHVRGANNGAWLMLKTYDEQ